MAGASRLLAVNRFRVQRYKKYLKWQKTRFLHFKITYIPIFLLQTPTNFAILHKKRHFMFEMSCYTCYKKDKVPSEFIAIFDLFY